MSTRLVVATALVVLALAVAWWLERRGRHDAPAGGAHAGRIVPEQLDRRDFPRPDAPWLVVLWTSRTCESCAGLREKLEPLESEDVAVADVEYQSQPELHARYRISAAPVTVVVDADGVTRASFAGAFDASELWAAVAALRRGDG
jgi:hypothetical protein